MHFTNRFIDGRLILETKKNICLIQHAKLKYL